jgi:hypothetical protein
MISGLPVRLPKFPKPTAMQVVALTQEMPFRPLTVLGMTSALHEKPELRELTTPSTPTAKQVAVVGHETELSLLKPAGGISFVQVLPASVVAIIVDPAPMLPLLPTAMQSNDDEHEIPARFIASDGRLSALHLAPLSEVPIAYGAVLRLVPTAMQSSTSGQSREFN